MKKLLMGFGIALAPCLAMAEVATVQSTALAGASTLVGNVGALLIAIIAIPLAFAGFKVVKRIINKA